MGSMISGDWCQHSFKRILESWFDSVLLGSLGGDLGSKIEVTLEIHAEIPAGVSENVVRIVTENRCILRVKSHGFEDETGE
jgi:hypothetical protein